MRNRTPKSNNTTRGTSGLQPHPHRVIRPKKKCFRKKQNTHKEIHNPNEIVLDPVITTPREEETPLPQGNEDKRKRNTGRYGLQPSSRPKKRCRFGPGRGGHLNDGKRRPPLCLLCEVPTPHICWPTQSLGTDKRSDTHNVVGGASSHSMSTGDWPTLSNPLPTWLSPFDRYRKRRLTGP